MKLFQRIIEPTDESIDVALERVIVDFHGHRPQVKEIEIWIDRGLVSLRVISLHTFLDSDDLALLKDHDFIDSLDGGDSAHRRLIALAWLYLRKIGKANACCRGASMCGYAGGWADACVPGEEYFVECGTMRYNKPYEAMLAAQTLLAVPYPTDAEPRRLAFEFRPMGPIEDPQAEAMARAREDVEIW